MMCGQVFATPYSTESMLFKILITCFKMIGIVKRFCYEVPLQGCAVTCINRNYFICTPAEGTMVNNDIVSSCSSKSIVSTSSIYHSRILVFIAHSKTQVPHDDIISTKTYRVIRNADASSRR